MSDKATSHEHHEKPFLTENDFIARFDKFRHGIFKSSLDHWIETGKLSGSFLLEVRSLIKHNSSEELDDWKQVIIMHKDTIYELESQLSSLESDLKALREEREGLFKLTVLAYESLSVVRTEPTMSGAVLSSFDKKKFITKYNLFFDALETFITSVEGKKLLEQFKAYTLNTEKN